MSERIVNPGEYKIKRKEGMLVIESLDSGAALAMYNPESKKAFLQYINPQHINPIATNPIDSANYMQPVEQFIASAKGNGLLTARIIGRISNIDHGQKIQASIGLVSQLYKELSDYLMPNQVSKENLTYSAEVSIDAANGKVDVSNSAGSYFVPKKVELHTNF